MLAISSPEIYDFDKLIVHDTLDRFAKRTDFVLPSGFGLQEYVGLWLWENTDAHIVVCRHPVEEKNSGWWRRCLNFEQRMSFVRVRTKTPLAMTTMVLENAKETLCFCEFDEHLMESDKDRPNAEPWRAARMSRRNGLPLATRVLRPQHESEGITQPLFLKD